MRNDDSNWGDLSWDEGSSKPITAIRVQNAEVDGDALIVDGVRNNNTVFDTVCYRTILTFHVKGGIERARLVSPTLEDVVRHFPGKKIPVFGEDGIWEYPDVNELNEGVSRQAINEWMKRRDPDFEFEGVKRVVVERVAFRDRQLYICDFTIGRPEWLS